MLRAWAEHPQQRWCVEQGKRPEIDGGACRDMCRQHGKGAGFREDPQQRRHRNRGRAVRAGIGEQSRRPQREGEPQRHGPGDPGAERRRGGD